MLREAYSEILKHYVPLRVYILYIGNHSRKKSFANELLWHSSRENIRNLANPRKFNCLYIGKHSRKKNFTNSLILNHQSLITALLECVYNEWCINECCFQRFVYNLQSFDECFFHLLLSYIFTVSDNTSTKVSFLLILKLLGTHVIALCTA